MRVHVLVGRDAGDGRFVHLHGFGHVLENHRLHVFVAVLEERGLTLHDAAGHLEERLVADLQAADQPARFLQLSPEHGVIGGTADEARITLIHANARQAGGIDVDHPASLGPAHEHIGHDVLGEARNARWSRGAAGRRGPVPTHFPIPLR